MQIIKNKERLFSILVIILLLMELVSSMFVISVSAAEIEPSTNALDDLKRDTTFDVSKYPEKANSSEIQVIQIAESGRRELYVYTYAPGNVANHRKAEYINMSMQAVTDKGVEYKEYSLTWLNNEGVFDKYLVNGYTVPNLSCRYYTIKAINRPYDVNIDDSITSVIIDGSMYKPYTVDQAWCAYYKSNKLIYEMETMERAEIDEWNYVRGTVTSAGNTKHYFAFAIENIDINKVYNVEYAYARYDYVKTSNRQTGALVEESVISSSGAIDNLNIIDTCEVAGVGLYERKYVWNNFSTYVKFSEENPFYNSEDYSKFRSKSFVLYIDTTPQKIYTTYDETTLYYSDVSIIHSDDYNFVYYLSEGKAYDIGRIGNTSSSGTDSGSNSVGSVIGGMLDSSDNDNALDSILLLTGGVVSIVLIVFLIKPIKSIWDKRKNDLGLKVPKKLKIGDKNDDE